MEGHELSHVVDVAVDGDPARGLDAVAGGRVGDHAAGAVVAGELVGGDALWPLGDVRAGEQEPVLHAVLPLVVVAGGVVVALIFGRHVFYCYRFVCFVEMFCVFLYINKVYERHFSILLVQEEILLLKFFFIDFSQKIDKNFVRGGKKDYKRIQEKNLKGKKKNVSYLFDNTSNPFLRLNSAIAQTT